MKSPKSREYFLQNIFFHHRKKTFSKKILFFHKLYSSSYHHAKDELLTPNTLKVLADTVSRTKKNTTFHSLKKNVSNYYENMHTEVDEKHGGHS